MKGRGANFVAVRTPSISGSARNESRAPLRYFEPPTCRRSFRVPSKEYHHIRRPPTWGREGHLMLADGQRPRIRGAGDPRLHGIRPRKAAAGVALGVASPNRYIDRVRLLEKLAAPLNDGSPSRPERDPSGRRRELRGRCGDRPASTPVGPAISTSAASHGASPDSSEPPGLLEASPGRRRRERHGNACGRLVPDVAQGQVDY